MEEVKESGATGAFAGYKIPRTEADASKKKVLDVKLDSGQRMDTIGGDDSENDGSDNGADYVDREEDGQLSDNANSDDVDKVSVDLDDLQDEDSDEAIDLSKNQR